MKKLLIILPLLFSGCFGVNSGVNSFKPVLSMSDSQLQNEYLDVQHKLRFTEAEYLSIPNHISAPPPTISSYTTKGTGSSTYGNTYNYSGTTTPHYSRQGSIDANLDSFGNSMRRLKLRREIDTLRSRLSTLRLELSRRGLFYYP